MMQNQKQNPPDRTRRKAIAFNLFALAVLSVALLAPFAGSAVAQTNNTSKAPYYDNWTSTPENESWMNGRENATLDNVIHYVTRVGGFIIGDPTQTAQGGQGSAAALVTGLVVMGVFLGTALGNGVGSVGGGVIAIMGAAGLVAIGVAPAWLYVVVLFGLGLVTARVAVMFFR